MIIAGGAATVVYSGTDTLVAIDGRVYLMGNKGTRQINVEKVMNFKRHMATPYTGIPQLPELEYLKSDPGEF